MPSTPRSSSRCISAGSSTVQTCTRWPRRWASRTSARGDHPERPEAVGDLRARDRGGAPAGEDRGPVVRGGRPQQCHPAGAERGAQAGSELPTYGGKAPLREGRDAHPVERAGPPHRLDQRADGAGVLDVDVDPDVGPGAQDVLEQRDRLPAADPGGPDGRPGQLDDPAGPVGDPVEGRVVEGEQDAVGGGVHVGLQVAEAEVDRPGERGQRVLQPRRPRRPGARTRSAPRAPGTRTAPTTPRWASRPRIRGRRPEGRTPRGHRPTRRGDMARSGR